MIVNDMEADCNFASGNLNKECGENLLNGSNEIPECSFISVMNGNFQNIVNTDMFFNFDFDLLKSVLSCQDTKILSDDALRGILNWIYYDVDDRKKHFKPLLQCTDTSALTSNNLNLLLKQEYWVKHPEEIKEELHKLLNEADRKALVLNEEGLMTFHEMTDKWKELITRINIFNFGFENEKESFCQCFNLCKGWLNPVKLPFSMCKRCAIDEYQGCFYFSGGLNNENIPSRKIIKYNPEDGTNSIVCSFNKGIWDATIYVGNKPTPQIYSVANCQSSTRSNVSSTIIFMLGGKNLVQNSILVAECAQYFRNGCWSNISKQPYKPDVSKIVHVAGGSLSNNGATIRIIHYLDYINFHVDIIPLREPADNINGRLALYGNEIYVIPNAGIKKFIIYNVKEKEWRDKEFSGGPNNIVKLCSLNDEDPQFPYLVAIGHDGKVFLFYPPMGEWRLLRSDFSNLMECANVTHTLITVGTQLGPLSPKADSDSGALLPSCGPDRSK